MKLIATLRARRAERRARRAQTLDEQAKLKLEREGRGIPGAETHGQPPNVFGGFGGPV